MAITENGIPDETDAHRPAFIASHLRHTWQAIRHNVPVWGYYFWSLVDNFEWTEGYDPRFRFGLIGVDFETQERHVRDSGRLYGAIAGAGGLTRDILDQYSPGLSAQLLGA